MLFRSGLAENRVRVIAPDVGGGFGPKFVFYPEEVAIPLAAKLLGRPVKWIEDRYESFTATTQERDQYWDVEAGFDAQGKLLGIRGRVIHDHGAYTPYGATLPVNSATNLIGPYVLPNYQLELLLCLTNKVPATPTRGAGRPQGTFVMERLLDRAAQAVERPGCLVDPARLDVHRELDGAPGTQAYARAEHVEAVEGCLIVVDDRDQQRRPLAALVARRAEDRDEEDRAEQQPSQIGRAHV